MKHWIALSFFLPATLTTHAFAQTDAKTSLQGRDVRQICAVTDFAKTLMPLVILDLTKLKEDNSGAKAYFYDEPSDTVRTVMEKAAAVCGAGVNGNFNEVVTALPSKGTTQLRWIATAGDVLWIVVLAPSTSNKIVQVVETRRKTRLAEDIAKLGDLLKAASKRVNFNEGEVSMIAFPYALHEVRADLSVKVMSADEKNPHEVITIKTGPPEHGWISANLPLNSVKELSLDKNNAVQLKDVPKEFLIGFNYQWGDVYDQQRWDVSRAFGTVMARFSKQPLDTLGAGLGYNFGFMSAFVAPVWIHQVKTAAPASANAAPPMRYKMNVRVGLTFDLGTAVGWVSKKAQ